jgi:hypothetical protein
MFKLKAKKEEKAEEKAAEDAKASAAPSEDSKGEEAASVFTVGGGHRAVEGASKGPVKKVTPGEIRIQKGTYST